jgi:hypothetical protein
MSVKSKVLCYRKDLLLNWNSIAGTRHAMDYHYFFFFKAIPQDPVSDSVFLQVPPSLP